MTRLPDAAIARLKDAVAWPSLPPDRYDVLGALGRGGMGTVYAARDHRLDRDVAVKVSNAPIAASDLDVRLKQEARVLAQLEHPGIVPVHDAGELDDGRWYYAMKLVRGFTLVEHVRTLRDEAAKLGVFERIAETVAFAHAAGIIHRDLKPSNIMVGSFGEVLVLDWGVAKILATPPVPPLEADAPRSASVPAGTASGTRVGTPGFMAPELFRGDASTAGRAADVYSLGALLFWMLTGNAPSSAPDAIARALTAVPDPSSRRLRAIVRKCLADLPGDRYADAAALVADLARYRAGLAVVAHPESLLERAGRFLDRYRAFILLVAAYLVMRALFAWSQRL